MIPSNETNTGVPLNDLSRLCIHTITTKPLSLQECVRAYENLGIAGITVWREALQQVGIETGRDILHNSKLNVVSLCRGGFFPAPTPQERQKAIDENLRVIDEAAAINAPLVVLVCGAHPAVPLPDARKQIEEGIYKILPHAEQAKIKLSIEPLHPMYADCRSAINTLKQANEIIRRINSSYLGVTIDVYHLWWDPELEYEIEQAKNWLFSFHVSDWRTPTRDLLNDRTLMGKGCIPIRQIRSWMEKQGFNGYIEVEIFSHEYWNKNQYDFLKEIIGAYLSYC